MSENELRKGIPGTRYSTLVPTAMSGVCPKLKKVALLASTEDIKAQMINTRRTSTFLAVRICLIKNPTSVEANTTPTAAQSPVKRRQNAALAQDARRRTRYLLAGGILTISSNLFFASSRDICSSAILQLSRLNLVFMSKLIGIG